METPIKNRINFDLDRNSFRLDSGNYPKYQRRENTYNRYDYNQFKNDRFNEEFDKAQKNIYDQGHVPSGQEIMNRLNELRSEGKWGGLKRRKTMNKRKRTNRRNKKNKTRKYRHRR